MLIEDWDKYIKIKEELFKFMTGNISITDSNKREWNAINNKSLFTGEEYIIEELKKIGVNIN